MSRPSRELEALWYKKLAKEGFSEIEDTQSEARLLVSWHSFKYQDMDAIKIQSIRLYYEEASHILETYCFENKTQRLIWELHAAGLTEREIGTRIRKYKKSMIHNVISKIAREILRK